MKTIFLKAGREKSLLHRHPWIFSGAIERVEGNPGSGETCAVRAARGEFLAWAAFSPVSKIRGRVWSWQEEQPPDEAWLAARLREAVEARASALPPKTTAYRLVHAESDGLPGLIADRYEEGVVVQFLSAGAERWRPFLVDWLCETTGAKFIYERSDVEVRKLEGLETRIGPVFGGMPPTPLVVLENGLKFHVDVVKGHKTGFYLDQRANRQRVRTLAAGKAVLNAFSYTGGFAVYALAGNAESVVSIDTSGEALALGRANVRENGFPSEKAEWIEGDVFRELRTFRDRGLSFDLIVLDPPKFAATAAQVEGAARGYKDINLLALKLLRPGGLLVTFSCSGGISAEFFQKIVAGAAVDAGVHAQIVERLMQGPDHPVALNFPEGEYLKGLVVRKQ